MPVEETLQAPSEAGHAPERNIKLVLEYDGTDFNGSQLQPGGRTVQGELEKALGRLTGQPPGQRCKVSLAGRTDTGVHARGQVASFRTTSAHSLETFRRGLNALLPFDVAVLQAQQVGPDFHARFSALERHYRYVILNREVRAPLERRFALQVAPPLDVTGLQAAADILVGEHDFASFAGAGWGVPAASPDENEAQPGTVRRLVRAKWRQDTSSLDSPVLALELAANAFLPHMVRNIVGTLLLVGKGELTPEGFRQILTARDRRYAGPTAPACGLSLVGVVY
jgi:tRNA pseudouridine38-40 synthase